MLTDVANKKEFHEWTDKEISLALNNIKPIITMALQNRLNLTLNKLTAPLLPLATPITALLATPIAIPPATLTATPATPTTPPGPTLIAILLATPTAAPITPTTPPGF